MEKKLELRFDRVGEVFRIRGVGIDAEVGVKVPVSDASYMELQNGRMIYFKRPDIEEIPIEDSRCYLITGSIFNIESFFLDDPRDSYVALSIRLIGLLNIYCEKWTYKGFEYNRSGKYNSINYSPMYSHGAFFLSRRDSQEIIGRTDDSLFEYLKEFPQEEYEEPPK